MIKNQTASQKKDKKITFMVVGEGQDEDGYPIEGNFPLPGGENIWAYYRQASGDEFYNAATTNSKVEAVFKVRWRNDLDTDMTILFRGQEYGITRIDEFEGYKQDLTIYAYTIVH